MYKKKDLEQGQQRPKRCANMAYDYRRSRNRERAHSFFDSNIAQIYIYTCIYIKTRVVWPRSWAAWAFSSMSAGLKPTVPPLPPAKVYFPLDVPSAAAAVSC